jgi:hypothetical protein
MSVVHVLVLVLVMVMPHLLERPWTVSASHSRADAKLRHAFFEVGVLTNIAELAAART